MSDTEKRHYNLITETSDGCRERHLLYCTLDMAKEFAAMYLEVGFDLARAEIFEADGDLVATVGT